MADQEQPKLCDQCKTGVAKYPVSVRSSEHPWIYTDEDWCEECYDARGEDGDDDGE